MDKLAKERKAIDKIDKKIKKLFFKRLEHTKTIGEYKKANNLPIEDLKREKEIIDSLSFDISNDKEEYIELLKKIFEISKSINSKE